MNRSQVVAEFRRASVAVDAAQLLEEKGFYADAVSRSYYAILHSAKAALQINDVNATTHQGVRRQFGQHLIRPGLIENEWSSVLSEGLDERLSADYDAEVVFDQAQAQREVKQARRFLER